MICHFNSTLMAIFRKKASLWRVFVNSKMGAPAQIVTILKDHNSVRQWNGYNLTDQAKAQLIVLISSVSQQRKRHWTKNMSVNYYFLNFLTKTNLLFLHHPYAQFHFPKSHKITISFITELVKCNYHYWINRKRNCGGNKNSTNSKKILFFGNKF